MLQTCSSQRQAAIAGGWSGPVFPRSEELPAFVTVGILFCERMKMESKDNFVKDTENMEVRFLDKKTQI